MTDLTAYTADNPHEFALGICANLRETLGVDVLPILTSPAVPEPERIRRAAGLLLEGILDRADREQLNDFLSDPTDPAENPTIAWLLGLPAVPGAIEPEPNMAISEKDALTLQGYEGQKVYDYVFTLTKRFELMATSTTVGQLVAQMAAGAVISVGVPMAVGVIKALRAGSKLLAAMKLGITGIGMKTAITAVVVVLAALLFYLLYENPKKILGVVINNTDENFAVARWDQAGGNLHMEHGEMVNFMQDNSDGLDSPTLQLKQRVSFGPGDPDNIVFAGFYFADRNIGFRGAEGVAVFTSTTSSLSWAHMFAVPYTSDNGTNARWLDTPPDDLSKLYRDMYDSRKTRVDFTSNSFRFVSTVNNARGGVVACIAAINGPQ
ncbi:hypothetical protein [Actinoplanes sp. NPDC051411]|uniref:hypothetical protein n=1 Tax=Actinoplanes sp. NPDC051411 TaxID=3155522 RepID=UPI00342037A9